MTRELNRLTLAILAGFAVVALSVTFWTVIQSDSLLARSDNARNVIAEQRIQRGTIYDANDTPLAFSRETELGLMQRVYPYPAAAGAVGYYSFTYGSAGIEAAFDDTLSGANMGSDWQQFVDDLLHRPQQGGDVRSTLDLDVQQAAAEAMRGHSGAVVVVHVPSGRVLAMVSTPNYDPNRIDQQWRTLTQNKATSPLLNRVTAGLYQPGGAMQTITLAAILASHSDLTTEGGYTLNTELPNVHDPIEVDDLVVACLPDTPDGPLTLAEAYAYGCPQPFVAALGKELLPERIWERWEALGLLNAPELAGFQTAAGEIPHALANILTQDEVWADVAGQGHLTLTPLHMIQVVAAIANRGNAVPLHLVDATRPPGSEVWQPVPIPVRDPALLRADVADAVRLTMLQAAALSPFVSQARRGDLVLYGHSAIAYAGPDATPYVWFSGFVDQTETVDKEAIAVVVVIEHEDDPGVAAQVAGEALAAAAE